MRATGDFMFSFFARIGSFLYQLTLQYGVIGLGVGTFFESLGVPTAAVVVELAAGLLIVSGRTNFLTALIISTIGLILGSVVSYYIGYLGSQAFGHWRPTAVDEVRHSKARQFLMRYGEISILFAQLFGPARTWISLPAGAMKLDIKRFIVYTGVGGAIYCSIAIGISYFFTNLAKAQINRLLSYVPLPAILGLGLGIAALFVIWRYLRFRRTVGDERL